MNRLLALPLLLVCACSPENAPAEQIRKEAEKIVAPTPTPVAKGRFAPRDNCGSVAGADEFRARLTAAVRSRDTDAMAELSARDIKLDFGGGEGAEELRKRLDDPSWGLWGELEELIQLGCSANRQGGITIPWYFDQDLGGANPFATMLVTGEDVPVLETPDPASERIGAVSWDLVEIPSLDPDRPYQQVKLPDGTTGFVATGKLRSVIDYRLIASSRNDRWRITSFVAGD
jgi:hypothetical protein